MSPCVYTKRHLWIRIDTAGLKINKTALEWWRRVGSSRQRPTRRDVQTRLVYSLMSSSEIKMSVQHIFNFVLQMPKNIWVEKLRVVWWNWLKWLSETNRLDEFVCLKSKNKTARPRAAVHGKRVGKKSNGIDKHSAGVSCQRPRLCAPSPRAGAPPLAGLTTGKRFQGWLGWLQYFLPFIDKVSTPVRHINASIFYHVPFSLRSPRRLY